MTCFVICCIFFSRRFFLRKIGLNNQEIKAIDTGTRGFRNKFPNEMEEFRLAERKLLEYDNNNVEYNKMIIRGIDFFGRKTLHFFSIMAFD